MFFELSSKQSKKNIEHYRTLSIDTIDNTIRSKYIRPGEESSVNSAILSNEGKEQTEIPVISVHSHPEHDGFIWNTPNLLPSSNDILNFFDYERDFSAFAITSGQSVMIFFRTQEEEKKWKIL